jgi:hypothetical protein
LIAESVRWCVAAGSLSVAAKPWGRPDRLCAGYAIR